MRINPTLALVLLLSCATLPRATAGQSPVTAGQSPVTAGQSPATPGQPTATAGPSSTDWYVGGGVGFGWGTLTLTADSEIGKASGAVLLGQVGLSRDGHRTWGLQIEIHPFRVPNPLLDERFRAVRASVGGSFFHPFYVAPGIGVEWRSWSGAERARDRETALLLTASVGRYMPVGPVTLLPEVSWSHSPVGRTGIGSSAGVSVRMSVLRLP